MVDSEIPWTAEIAHIDQIGRGEGRVGVADLLATMFAQQRAHMGVYNDILNEKGITPLSEDELGELTNERVHRTAREFASYTVEEMYEAINHLKGKPWKRSFNPPDREAFLEEIADMWHFFIEFHIILGISPTDVFNAYFKKTLVNQARQQNGY